MTTALDDRAAPPVRVDGPYVGLTYFTEDDAAYFFGREAECSVIVGNLCASRLTLLYAESGVGKSSLLRAGALARIRAQGMRDAGEGHPPRFVGSIVNSWTADPLSTVLDAIEEAAAPFLYDPLDLTGLTLEEAIATTTRTLDTTLLVVLDQFEEYFLYHSNTNGSESLADQLARCVMRQDLHANFLIAIREDMYAGLGDLFRGRIPNVYANFLHLDYLDLKRGRAAIIEPIELLQRARPEVDIEPKLVDVVLDGVRVKAPHAGTEDGDGTDTKPVRIETAYLQLVMKRLWDEEEAADSPVLHLETLQRLKGTQEIIEGHLTRAMLELQPNQLDTAASAFQFLVTRAGTKIAWTTKDLAEVSKVAESKLDPVLRRLAEPDLKILRRTALRDEPERMNYEIFHDALARPIVRWREDHRVARERAAKEDAERAADEASKRATRERRRKLLALGGLAAAVVALLAVSGAFTWIQSRTADKEKQRKESLEIAGRLSSAEAGVALSRPAVALAGLEAVRLEPTFEARNVLLRLLQDNAVVPTLLEPLGGGHSVAFAPGDTGEFASDGDDGSIRLWSKTGKAIGSLPGRGGKVSSLAYSPDGRLLAAGLDDGGVVVWTLGSRQSRPLVPPTTPEECDSTPCTPVAFSPDGTMLVAGSNAGRVRVWHVESLSKPVQVTLEGGTVHALAFSADGSTLAAAGDSGLSRWDVADGRIARRVHTQRPAPAYAVAWGTDGTLAVGGDSSVHLWTPAHKVLETASAVHALSFVGGGSRLAYGGEDQNVTVRDLVTGDIVDPPRSHGDSVNSIAVSPDGNTIATTSADLYVRLWHVRERDALVQVSLGRLGETYVAFSSDGHAASGNTQQAPVHVWRPAPDGSRPSDRPVTALRDTIAPLAFGGRILAATSLSSPDTFTLFDVGSSCRTMPREACELGSSPARPALRALYTIAVDPTATFAVTGSTSGAITAWDVSNPRRVRMIDEVHLHGEINGVALRPRNSNIILATAADDRTVQLWRLDHGGIEHLSKQVLNYAPWGVDLSPDGKLVAAVGRRLKSAWAGVWNIEDPRKPLGVAMPIAQSTVMSVAFSPDGRTLAAGDGDGSVCLYDVRRLRFVGSLRCLTGSAYGAAIIDSIAFDPEQRFLLATGRGEPVLAWSSLLWGKGSEAQFTAAVCRLAGRKLDTQEWAFAFHDTRIEHRPNRTCSQ